MNRWLVLALLVLGAVTAGSSPKKKLVYRVAGVTATRSGTVIIVDARGSTRTGGWTMPELVRTTGTASTIVLRFLAVPPSGMATQVITPIAAKKEIGPLRPPFPKRVKVVAETNSVMVEVR